MVHIVKAIDAHAGGEPLRLIVDGVPPLPGGSMAKKRDWLQRTADGVRRAVILEPRGHRDMFGAILTEPVSPGAHAGIVFMHADGYAGLCGHGVMGVATIALERGLLFTRETGAGGEQLLVFDTPGGMVQCRARVVERGGERRVDSVVLVNVPAFVHSGGHPVRLGTRELRVDIAFGGAFYAIVDTEAIGLPLSAARLPELRRIGAEIRASLDDTVVLKHPADPASGGLAGVVFTAAPHDPEAHLRNVTVFGNGIVDRSPCGTGTSAVMAVLDAMGLLQEGQAFVHESLVGSLYRGRITRRTQVGELPAIVTEIEGSAWITGEHTFYLADDDPFREGFSL